MPTSNNTTKTDSKVFKSILVKNPKPMELSNFNEKLLTLFADIAPIEPIATAPVAAIVVVIIAIQPNEVIVLPVLQQAHTIFAGNNLFFDIFVLHRATKSSAFLLLARALSLIPLCKCRYNSHTMDKPHHYSTDFFLPFSLTSILIFLFISDMERIFVQTSYFLLL